MKKSVFTIIVLLSILAVLSTTAASTTPTRSASLETIKYIPGKGVVLIFNLDGAFNDIDFKDAYHTYLVVDKQVYGLACSEKSDTQAICEAPGKIKQFAGKKISGAFAGFPFYGTIPIAANPNDK